MQTRKNKILPLPDPRLVPRYLLDQIKEKTWSTDEWYTYNLEQMGNNNNQILGIIDKSNLVKGFIWYVVDSFNKYIFVNNISLDKSLQFDKKLFEDIDRYLRGIGVKFGLDKFFWITKRPRAFVKKGYKKSDYVLVEEEVKNGSRSNKGQNN